MNLEDLSKKVWLRWCEIFFQYEVWSFTRSSICHLNLFLYYVFILVTLLSIPFWTGLKLPNTDFGEQCTNHLKKGHTTPKYISHNKKNIYKYISGNGYRSDLVHSGGWECKKYGGVSRNMDWSFRNFVNLAYGRQSTQSDDTVISIGC